MWRRVFTAQRLLTDFGGQSVLDFGSGMGVLLPYLEENFRHVVACDRDAEITEFMMRRLNLKHVEVIRSISDCQGHGFDVVVALDILEHVDDLSKTIRSLEDLTAKDGRWVVSGPTESALYRLGRKIARTTGEGHVRTIYDVLEEIRGHMTCEIQCKLPPVAPFFLVALLRKGPESVAMSGSELQNIN
jgi:SAM-dependent methyltransferase